VLIGDSLNAGSLSLPAHFPIGFILERLSLVLPYAVQTNSSPFAICLMVAFAIQKFLISPSFLLWFLVFMTYLERLSPPKIPSMVSFFYIKFLSHLEFISVWSVR
jgi:hypothetical protein